MSLNEAHQLNWIHDLYQLGQSDLLQNKADEVFERILHHIVKGFNANTGSLALRNGDDDQLSIVAGIGLPPECIGSVIAPGSGIIGWVVENGKPLLLKGDVADDPRFRLPTRRKQTSVPSSALCWPLQLDNRIIGALSVNSLNEQGGYTEGDLELGLVPVNLITMVIDNARLHHEKQQQNKALEEKVEHRTRQIKEAMQHLDLANENLKKQYIDSIRAFSRIIEMRPGIKSGQSKYIAEKSLLVARKLDLDADEKKNILYAGLLIQIGKMSLPDRLLAVPFYKIPPLDKQNYLKHAVEGEALLNGLTQLQGASILIRHQYERYDGSGFPDHLAKENIPMGSRILNVVGDYISYLEGSMTGEAMPVKDVIAQLISRKETYYDPIVIDAFIEVLQENVDETEAPPEPEKKSWRNSKLFVGAKESASEFDRPVIEISISQLKEGMEVESIYFGNKPYMKQCVADNKLIHGVFAVKENTGTDPTIKIYLGKK